MTISERNVKENIQEGILGELLVELKESNLDINNLLIVYMLWAMFFLRFIWEHSKKWSCPRRHNKQIIETINHMSESSKRAQKEYSIRYD